MRRERTAAVPAMTAKLEHAPRSGPAAAAEATRARTIVWASMIGIGSWTGMGRVEKKQKKGC